MCLAIYETGLAAMHLHKFDPPGIVVQMGCLHIEQQGRAISAYMTIQMVHHHAVHVQGVAICMSHAAREESLSINCNDLAVCITMQGLWDVLYGPAFFFFGSMAPRLRDGPDDKISPRQLAGNAVWVALVLDEDAGRIDLDMIPRHWVRFLPLS